MIIWAAVSNSCPFFSAEESHSGIGFCGWLLTAISWGLVVVTLPFSLCVCFKVRENIFTFPFSLCACFKVEEYSAISSFPSHSAFASRPESTFELFLLNLRLLQGQRKHFHPSFLTLRILQGQRKNFHLSLLTLCLLQYSALSSFPSHSLSASRPGSTFKLFPSHFCVQYCKVIEYIFSLSFSIHV